MARFKDGIMGGFSGKIGNVVGCQLKGLNYMRSLPRLRKSKRISEAEHANRKKFAEAQFWLKPLTGFVRVGFKNYHPTYQGFVAAKSYLIKNAIKGDYPDIFIDPSLMLVSYGDLPGCFEPRVECEEPGKINFYWTQEKQQVTARYQDLVMLVAYDTVNKKVMYDTSAAKRKAGKAVLEGLDKSFGKVVDIYISFTSSDRERISKSQYLGKLELKQQ